MIDHLLQSCVHYAHTFISFNQTYFEVLVSTTTVAVDTFTDFAAVSTTTLEVFGKNKIVRKPEFAWVIIANNLVGSYVEDMLEFT